MAEHRPLASQSSFSDPRGARLPPTLTTDLPVGDRHSDFPAPMGLASPGSADPLPHADQVPRGSNDGASSPSNHAVTAASRYANTDRPC